MSSYSGDAAEQVVRMSLETGEVAVKLAGTGAKQLAILLYAILREQKKTKGKTRLTNMLRSGKELKVFAVKDTDLQLFCREAKKYGVLYCVLKDRDATDGITDIMVRAEDASKINRIFERFDLATVDMAEIRSEIERTRAEQTADGPEPPAAAEPMTEQETEEFLDALFSPVPEQEGELPTPERTVPEQDKDEFLAALLGPDPAKEEGQTQTFMGPPQNQEILRGEEEQGSVVNSTRQGGVSGADFATTKGRVAKSRQSEPTSRPKEPAGADISDPQERSRPSVCKELDEIKAERREKAASSREQAKTAKGPKHLAPRKKYKPKRLKER